MDEVIDKNLAERLLFLCFCLIFFMKKFFLLIDEVQLTAKAVDKENGGIEITIYDMLNELKAYKNLDVYVTGSHSKGLSNDIATEFRGRATQIRVYPLSFREYDSYVDFDERRAPVDQSSQCCECHNKSEE